MSYVSNETQYLELIHQLIGSQIDGDYFCREFSSLCKIDGDELSSKSEVWPEQYDLQLIESHRQGKISPDEFERKWVELWGYGEYVHLLEMLDSIFTACDVFNPMPKLEYEIDDAQLKRDVGARLADYEAEKAKRRF